MKINEGISDRVYYFVYYNCRARVRRFVVNQRGHLTSSVHGETVQQLSIKGGILMLEENFWEHNCSGVRDRLNNTYLEIGIIE